MGNDTCMRKTVLNTAKKNFKSQTTRETMGMMTWINKGTPIRLRARLRDLQGLVDSLCLKFTNEPSTFEDGDLAESIKCSDPDRLGDLVPRRMA